MEKVFRTILSPNSYCIFIFDYLFSSQLNCSFVKGSNLSVYTGIGFSVLKVVTKFFFWDISYSRLI